MTDQNGNALENALKQIQSWFVSGDFEKVIRGCNEILIAAPNNSIAQDLLKKAEESSKVAMPAPAPTPAAPAPAPVDTQMAPPPPPPPAPSPMPEPLPEPVAPMPIPEPIDASMPTPVPMGAPMPMPMPEPIPMPGAPEEHHKAHSLMVNLAILAGIILIGFGMVWGYHTFFNKEEVTPTPPAVTEETPTDEVIEPDGKPGTEEVIPEEETPSAEIDLTTMEGRNAQRTSDLTQLETALMGYFDEFKQYPAADELASQLKETNYLETLPMPPTADEAYMYAVYSTDLDQNQVFVLSAEFEEANGEKTIWSPGENSKDYPDYRDDSKENVIAITNTEAITTPPSTEIPTEETPVDPTKIRVPRTPRNAQ